MEKRINEIEFCPVPPINDTMNDAYQISKTIPFNVNSYIYFDQIYQAFKHEIDSNEEFLKNVECYYSRNLFKEILDRTKMYTTTNIQLNQIQPNDILLINSPSIFAKYHFIIATVNEDATQVNIYQSYGSYKRLHKITLPIQDFINLMNQLLTLKTGNFIDDYQLMITIENQLYGINIHEYIERLEDYFDERVYDPDDYGVPTNAPKRVIRGGSFLCNEDYCQSYRPSARRGADPYSPMSHLGFRLVKDSQ